MKSQPIIKQTLDSLQHLLNKTKEEETTAKETKNIIYNSINNLSLVNDITSVNGFIKMYFEVLPNATTKKKAFEAINRQHKELLGFYKYNTHKEFRNALMN